MIRGQVEGLIGSMDRLAVVGDLNFIGIPLVAFFMGCLVSSTWQVWYRTEEHVWFDPEFCKVA